MIGIYECNCAVRRRQNLKHRGNTLRSLIRGHNSEKLNQNGNKRENLKTEPTTMGVHNIVLDTGQFTEHAVAKIWTIPASLLKRRGLGLIDCQARWCPQTVKQFMGKLRRFIWRHLLSYYALLGGRFPRVFGDKFGEEFCDKFGDEFSESPNLVMN